MPIIDTAPSELSTTHAPARETHGQEILQWGALIALIVETIIVLGGITTAVILR